jgi:hypothetical protein
VKYTIFTFTIFSALVSVLISGTWSNVYVFAQHSSMPWSPPASLQQSSSDSGSNTPGWTTLITAAKPLAIAPQPAINQEQEPQLLSNNGTGIQGYTSNSPVMAQDKLMYLGYHSGDNTPTNGDSSPNDKSSSDSNQPSIHRSSSTTSGDDSTGKKKTSSTKLDRADSANKDSNPKKDKSSSSRSSVSTNDGSESLSLLPNLESPIKNKAHSIIKNTISSIKDNTPLLLPFP